MSKQRRWQCPRCGSGVLAPSRPRKDDVRRFCLPCSEETGKLAPRVCAALEAKRSKKADTRAARAKTKRAREAVKRRVKEKQLVKRRVKEKQLEMVARKWSRKLTRLGISHSTETAVISERALSSLSDDDLVVSPKVITWIVGGLSSRYRSFADIVAAIWPDLPTITNTVALEVALYESITCLECRGSLVRDSGLWLCKDCGGGFESPVIVERVIEERLR